MFLKKTVPNEIEILKNDSGDGIDKLDVHIIKLVYLLSTLFLHKNEVNNQDN